MKALMRRAVTVLAVAGVFAGGAPALVAQQTPQAWPTGANREVRPPQSWEEDIKKFEAADRQTPPPPNGVVFIGSSSIVRWDLPKYFSEPGPKAINRGFGGTVAAD